MAAVRMIWTGELNDAHVAVAGILALFTVAASVFFHNYWSLPADKAFVNQLMFFKNIAISGGLLAFVAFGAGRFSIDRK